MNTPPTRHQVFPRLAGCGLLLVLVPAACGEPKLAGGGGGAMPAGGGVPESGGRPGPGFTLPPANPMVAGDAGALPPGTGTCAAEVRQAGRLPVDLLFVVDKSGSMDVEIFTRDMPPMSAGTQWDLVREALMTFVQDPRSTDLGVGLQLFPLVPRNNMCTQDADCMFPECQPPRARCSGTGRPCPAVGQPCGATRAGDLCTEIPPTCRLKGFAMCEGNYGDPVVPVMPLPGGREPFATLLMYTEPEGMTPMEPAVRGGLAHLRARLQANAGRRSALVLVTDGFPVGCEMRIEKIAEIIAADQKANPSIATFVIGIFAGGTSNVQATFDQLAQAGGTGQAIILEPNQDLSARFLTELEKIRDAVLPCEFDIPAPQNGPLDFGRVNLRWKSATAMEDVLYVERADRCDPTRGGWYYDVPPAQGRPARVLVCPATCQRFKSEQAATVELSFGCQTRTID